MKPRVSKAMNCGIEAFHEKNKSYQNTLFQQKVTEFLKGKPHLAEKVFLALEPGMFEAKQQSGVEDIPSTRTHLSLISSKFIQAVLNKMCPALTLPLLKAIQKRNAKDIHNLFYFVVSEKAESTTFSHQFDVFAQHYIERHIKLGERLQLCKISQDGEIDWTVGMFSVELEGKTYVIKHISGATVQALGVSRNLIGHTK